MILRNLRAVGRVFRIIVGLLGRGLWSTWRFRHSGADHQRLTEIRRAWYAYGLQVAGVKVVTRGAPEAGAAVLVANHVSWLDIPVLGSCADPRFLSKAEVARWPLVGFLARRNGTLFIQRGSNQANAAVEAMVAALRSGQRVAFFPETTTGPGTYVRRFQPRLLAAAIAAEVPVQPVAINYLADSEGLPSAAPFVLGDRFIPHVWTVLQQREIQVEIHFLNPIPVSVDTHRRELANTARLAIVRALNLPEAPPEDPIRWDP